MKGTNSALRYSPMTPAEVSENWLCYSGSRILPRKRNLVETMLLSSLLEICWPCFLYLLPPPPQFKWRMLTLCTGTFEMLGYYQCAKWAAFDAGDLQKVWWRVRRQCASKYIQGGGDETVERNLETIIKINAIGGHCWTCCTSLDSFDWFPVTHQRGGELCSLGLCPWISEMHVSLHAPRARSKSQRSPLIGLPEIKRCK